MLNKKMEDYYTRMSRIKKGKKVTALLLTALLCLNANLLVFAMTEYVENVTNENGLTWEIRMSEVSNSNSIFVDTVVDENGVEWTIKWREIRTETEQDPRLRVIGLVRGVYEYEIVSPYNGSRSSFVITVEFGNTSAWWSRECTYIYCNQYSYGNPYAANVGRSYDTGRCEFWDRTEFGNTYKIVGYTYQLNDGGTGIVVTQY